MRYEVGLLERILENYFNNRSRDTDPEEQRSQALQFEEEVARIEAAFMDMLFSPVSEPTRKRYIRHHQQRLQCMEEKLHRYMQSNRVWLEAAEATGNYQQLRAGLERLLMVIETHYRQDMLTDSIAPAEYNKRVTEYIMSITTDISQRLSDLKIEKRLSDLLLESLEQFAERKGYRLCCYGQLYMMRNIGHELMHHQPLPGSDKPPEQTRWLIEMLCRYNFNRLTFYGFCKDWIVQYLAAAPDKLYLYARCGKFFSRLPVLPSEGWNLQRMTITAMLTDYFKDSYLSEKRRLQQEILLSGGIGAMQTGRLTIQLTVEQLGLFIRLLNESGALKSKSSASVIRFFARHISTAGKAPTEEISYDHLKNSYIKSSLPVIEKVDDLLQEMGAQLRKIKMEARRAAKQ